MKKLLYFLCLIITLVSCSDSSKDPYSIDFGKVKYRDIFDGHKGCDFFRNHLEYFPFRWTKSDTVVSTKNIEIQFNKDCVRSGTEVGLLIADKNQKINDGLDVMIDGVDCTNRTFNVSATDTLQELSISLRVNPSLGDTVLSGHIFASSDNLEIANEVNMNGISPISQWTVRQVIKLNWWYWIIWLLFLIIIVALIWYFRKFIVYLYERLKSHIGELFGGIKDRGRRNRKKENNSKKERKIWLQTVYYNDLLLGFKVSKAQYISNEDSLSRCVWWDESKKVEAIIFARKLTRFVRRNYQKRHRKHFIPQPLNSKSKKYIWINVPYRSHVRDISIVERSVNKFEDLRYCLYFPNTEVGYRHANELLNSINEYIENV